MDTKDDFVGKWLILASVYYLLSLQIQVVWGGWSIGYSIGRNDFVDLWFVTDKHSNQKWNRIEMRQSRRRGLSVNQFPTGKKKNKLNSSPTENRQRTNDEPKRRRLDFDATGYGGAELFRSEFQGRFFQGRNVDWFQLVCIIYSIGLQIQVMWRGWRSLAPAADCAVLYNSLGLISTNPDSSSNSDSAPNSRGQRNRSAGSCAQCVSS